MLHTEIIIQSVVKAHFLPESASEVVVFFHFKSVGSLLNVIYPNGKSCNYWIFRYQLASCSNYFEKNIGLAYGLTFKKRQVFALC